MRRGGGGRDREKNDTIVARGYNIQLGQLASTPPPPSLSLLLIGSPSPTPTSPLPPPPPRGSPRDLRDSRQRRESHLPCTLIDLSAQGREATQLWVVFSAVTVLFLTRPLCTCSSRAVTVSQVPGLGGAAGRLRSTCRRNPFALNRSGDECGRAVFCNADHTEGNTP